MISCPGNLSTVVDATGNYLVSCSAPWDVSTSLLTLGDASSISTAVALLLATAFVFRVLFRFVFGGK